ncbi:MAG: phage tail tape measure protein [Bacilli bacterium]
MSENLSIVIKTILASAKESNLDEQIKQLSMQIKERLELKLKIDASDLEILTKKTEETVNKLKSKTTMKGSQFINLDVERQAFNDISTRIREVRKNVDELAKVDINTNKKGQITSATLTYYNKQLGQTITETMGWSEATKKVNGEMVKLKNFETLGFKYSDNMAKARAEAEKFTKQTNAVTQSLLNQRNTIERRDFNWGNLITGVNASTFDSGDNFSSYIKRQYGDSAELIGKFNDKQLKTGEIITQANFRVKEGSDKWRMYQATLNKTTGDMRLLDNGLKDVVNRQIGFNEALKIAFTRITQWGIATSIVYGSLRQFKEGLNTLKEIDTALIDIAKVTNYTNEEIKKLTKTAINAGQELGRTAQEYLSAVTEFARAGMGKQSEEYAKLSLLLQNVGDITAEVANETLIAANAGFQLEGSYDKLLAVIDKFNNISNLNATNINKLSEAMKVGASVFNAAGMSLDETVAIIGTATASTQRAGSEISRAWRTILMNIRQVSDEEAEVTEESMKKAEKALNAVGIVVRDSPSTFRPMFEIIRDLGTVWNDLTQVKLCFAV